MGQGIYSRKKATVSEELVTKYLSCGSNNVNMTCCLLFYRCVQCIGYFWHRQAKISDGTSAGQRPYMERRNCNVSKLNLNGLQGFFSSAM